MSRQRSHSIAQLLSTTVCVKQSVSYARPIQLFFSTPFSAGPIGWRHHPSPMYTHTHGKTTCRSGHISPPLSFKWFYFKIRFAYLTF
ncbi:unnamed protein product [Protopolystoma xenopodis]|uniref:Uncharacterized protein n=1 Tax=Protopolystoma xenopodis TaxID=117903 RepID=A0A448XRE7_9PLAT|nr:unnamed protein product [Protopolystoma xenopodis]